MVAIALSLIKTSLDDVMRTTAGCQIKTKSECEISSESRLLKIARVSDWKLIKVLDCCDLDWRSPKTQLIM